MSCFGDLRVLLHTLEDVEDMVGDTLHVADEGEEDASRLGATLTVAETNEVGAFETSLIVVDDFFEVFDCLFLGDVLSLECRYDGVVEVVDSNLHIFDFFLSSVGELGVVVDELLGVFHDILRIVAHTLDIGHNVVVGRALLFADVGDVLAGYLDSVFGDCLVEEVDTFFSSVKQFFLGQVFVFDGLDGEIEVVFGETCHCQNLLTYHHQRNGRRGEQSVVDKLEFLRLDDVLLVVRARLFVRYDEGSKLRQYLDERQ